MRIVKRGVLLDVWINVRGSLNSLISLSFEILFHIIFTALPFLFNPLTSCVLQLQINVRARSRQRGGVVVSPHEQLRNSMPPITNNPSSESIPPGYTNFLGVTSPLQTLFRREETGDFSAIASRAGIDTYGLPGCVLDLCVIDYHV